MDLGHKGKTVIISGGSKGIGAGISEVFAQEGANLVIRMYTVVYHSSVLNDEAGNPAILNKVPFT